MNLKEFSLANRDRCESASGFNHPLNSWSTSDWFTATMGELGEAANVAKKLNRVRDGIIGNEETPEELRRKLASELADTFIYLDLLAQSAGVDLADAVSETFDAKSKKIGYATNLTRDTEDHRGNKVARAVWAWLQEQKAIQYVPWVVNPESEKYDPAKAKEQEQRDEILSDLEQVISNAVSSR